MKLIIIGNGIAALAAAESFRKFDRESEVLILSGDAYPTYYRIKLSHYLGKPGFEDAELLVKDQAWFQEKQIEVRLGTWVSRIDFGEKQVILESGESLSYDSLLLANGASPFVPPVQGRDTTGVLSLRTLDDLKHIHGFLEGKTHVTVVGGGLLGLEAAHGLVVLGKRVTVLEFFPYLLPRQLDPELSAVVQKQLEREGIEFILGDSGEAILGTDTVTALQLKSGSEVLTDAVIFSAGVRPNLGLYEGTPLAIGKGVQVNERMQTNLPGVYAAGDIVEYQGTVFGLWTAANEQGKIAGHNLAGQELTYAAPQLVATLNIGEVKLFSAGDVSDPERVITYRDNNVFHRLFVKSGQVVGAALTGDISLMMKAKNLVLHKRQVPIDIDENELFMALMA